MRLYVDKNRPHAMTCHAVMPLRAAQPKAVLPDEHLQASETQNTFSQSSSNGNNNGKSIAMVAVAKEHRRTASLHLPHTKNKALFH